VVVFFPVCVYSICTRLTPFNYHTTIWKDTAAVHVWENTVKV
ncbi:unnamed protein product, partial [Callosobruchus maculatus]